MKVQILWVPPAERRFGSGDILTAAQLEEFGVSAQALLEAGEAQLIEAPAKPAAKRAKGGGVMASVRNAAKSLMGGD